MNQPGDLTESAPPGFQSDEVMRKADVENFSVASRLIPRRYREHLLAMYGFARFVDDIGDQSTGDRIAQLDWAESEILLALVNRATHPIFVRAGAVAQELSMGPAPFLDLIRANRRDQTVRRYEDYAGLESYCALSANPVGQMVLAIFGVRDANASMLSDYACTALQIIEHLQDVGEDFANDRIYLPKEDLVRFGVDERELGAHTSSDGLRSLVAFEARRAARLLDRADPLIGMVHGFARIAIAGFIGGGRAQLDALRAADFEVLAKPVKAHRSSLALRSIRTYLFRGRQP